MSGAEKEIDVASASATLPMAVMNMLVDASWTTERPICASRRCVAKRRQPPYWGAKTQSTKTSCPVQRAQIISTGCRWALSHFTLVFMAVKRSVAATM
jgi:hypothetical protein